MWILAQEEKRGNDRIFITGHNVHLSGHILPGVCFCYRNSAHKSSAASLYIQRRQKSMDLQEQYSRLLRYCFVKTKDRYLAEDIVQESYLRFWQSHSYRDTGREMAYLYTIARNLCIRECRWRADEMILKDRSSIELKLRKKWWMSGQICI